MTKAGFFDSRWAHYSALLFGLLLITWAGAIIGCDDPDTIPKGNLLPDQEGVKPTEDGEVAFDTASGIGQAKYELSEHVVVGTGKKVPIKWRPLNEEDAKFEDPANPNVATLIKNENKRRRNVRFVGTYEVNGKEKSRVHVVPVVNF